MNDYRQLALSIAAIPEEDLILFKVSADEKAHIVKQFNRALINAQGDGTDVAQIFLKPLIAKYPTWGDAALVFGLCLAREYQFKRAEESLEFAINNVLSAEINLQLAQEALRMVREDAKNPIPQHRNPNEMQEKGSMVSEMGAIGDRRGMQAPILMRASKNPAKAQMASDKERRDIMMRSASGGDELASGGTGERACPSLSPATLSLRAVSRRVRRPGVVAPPGTARHRLPARCGC